MGCAQSLSKRLSASLFDVEVYDPATQADVSFTNICAEEAEFEAHQAQARHAGPAIRPQTTIHRNVHATVGGAGVSGLELHSTTNSNDSTHSSTTPKSASGGGRDDLATQWRNLNTDTNNNTHEEKQATQLPTERV